MCRRTEAEPEGDSAVSVGAEDIAPLGMPLKNSAESPTDRARVDTARSRGIGRPAGETDWHGERRTQRMK